ncbi:MAG TPA: RidA family protein [Firmicutes bacterium]|jgi:2-iminobutanoate/2-iminopropanoate deaminase|nr:RidA family protein [Bacillota bacterium]
MANKALGTKEQLEYLKKNGIPLSPAIRYGNLIFVSGQPPVDLKSGVLISGDIEKQTEQVMENLKITLESSGSSLNKVLKTTIYATNAGFYDQINKVYARYFNDSKPARTFVTVGSFNTGFDIEIDCIAFVED